MNRPALCQAAQDCGVFCLNCPVGASEFDRKWNLLVKDSEQLKTFLSDLEAHKIKASIGGVSGVDNGEDLTARQMEVLSRAISLGYFEFPRRLSLTALSRELGIKPSTLSQLLRSAEGKIMWRYAESMKISKLAPNVKGDKFF